MIEKLNELTQKCIENSFEYEDISAMSRINSIGLLPSLIEWKIVGRQNYIVRNEVNVNC